MITNYFKTSVRMIRRHRVHSIINIAGLAVGMAAAFGLTRLMVALLFHVEPTDPITYAVVGLGLFGVALLAAWVPARRAASTDPARALRAE